MRANPTDYFLRATGAKSIRAIAIAADLEPSTLTRQMGAKLTAESVIAICRTYDLDFADAFVAAGFLTDEEANRLGARVGLAAYSDLELAREIVRRIEDATATDALTGELPPVHDVRGERQDDYAAVADERDGIDETDEGFH